MPLGDVVGIGHVAVGDEHEQMRPVGGDALAQLAARFAERDGRHDAVEPAIQIGAVLRQRGVLQRLSSSSDGDRAQQQPLERGAEFAIAALDGVARIAQQMRQAYLPVHRMAALAAQHSLPLRRRGDTQTSGCMAPNSACTTALPRLGRITCSTANEPMNTHSHHVLPLTRAEVSSEHTTGLAVTAASIAAAAASSGSRARASMLLIAPSLMLSEKMSPISAAKRSRPIAWA
jgi:hypothetical protein